MARMSGTGLLPSKEGPRLSHTPAHDLRVLKEHLDPKRLHGNTNEHGATGQQVLRRLRLLHRGGYTGQELGAQVPAEAITSTVKDLLFKKHTSNAAMSCAAGEDGA